MPKVPYQGVSDQPLRPVSQERQSVPAATPAAFGAGRGYEALGASLSEAATVAQRIQHDAMLQDDHRAARDAMTAYSAARRELLYGTSEKPGYMLSKGQTALDNLDTTSIQLTKTRRQLSDGLSQGARDLFDSASMNEMNGDLDKMTNFSYSQRDAANQASDEGAIEEANNTIAANPFDDSSVITQRRIARGRALTIGLRQGWKEGSAEMNNLLYKVDSGLLTTGMESIISRSTVADAKIYYATYKGALEGGDQLAVEKRLEQAERSERADHAAARAEQNEAREQYERAEYNRLVHLYTTDELTAKLVDQSGASPGSKNTMLNQLESDAENGGKAIHNDPIVYSDLLGRVWADDNDPTKIWDTAPIREAMIDRKITAATGEKLMGYLSGRDNSPEGRQEAGYRKQLYDLAFSRLVSEDPFSRIKDTKGRAHLLAWQADVDKQWDALRQHGGPNGESVPASALVDPESKYFLGAGIDSYRRPLKEIFEDIATDNATPGETVPGQVAAPAGAVNDVAKVPIGTYLTMEEAAEAYQNGEISLDVAKGVINRDQLKHRVPLQ